MCCKERQIASSSHVWDRVFKQLTNYRIFQDHCSIGCPFIKISCTTVRENIL